MSSTSPTDPATASLLAAIDLSTTAGALEIGQSVSIFLMGILTMQCFLYFRNFHEDNWWLKAVVLFVCIGEIVQVILVSNALYQITISFYGVRAALLVVPWQVVAAFVCIATIGFTVQLYMIVRIWYVAGQVFIVGICSLLSVARFIALITLAGYAQHLKALSTLLVKFKWLCLTAGSIGAASDILISISLFYSLWRTKRGLESLRTVLDKLAISAIETGVISGILGIAAAIAFVTLNGSFAWLGIWLVNGKVFSNSLLASLNLRIVYRESLKVQRPKSQQPLRRPKRTFPFLEPDSIAIEMSTTTIRGDDFTDLSSKVASAQETPNPYQAAHFKGGVGGYHDYDSDKGQDYLTMS